MPTIKELELKITDLKTKALDDVTKIADLEAKVLVATGLVKEPEEEQVELLWPHLVDTSSGAEPSAYGVKLVLTGKKYTGKMPASRAKVELARKGKSFVKK